MAGNPPKKMEFCVVIPNWNGQDYLKSCIDSLLDQDKQPVSIIVVENGSKDDSLTILESYGDKIVVLRQDKNLGFAGGVNQGIRWALEKEVKYIALFNNDAVADKNWAYELVKSANQHANVGMVTSRFLSFDGQKIDSTGDFYTAWGLPFPRGRDEESTNHYLEEEFVFGASGGASLYRAEMLRDIGLFDEDFFAYFEDVDISFRAQLAGWKVLYQPKAIAHHLIGGTSKKIKGFAVYQTFKNFPIVFLKNVPGKLFIKLLPKVLITYFALLINAVKKGNGLYALKGAFAFMFILPKKVVDRRRIQRKRVVSVDYIDSIIIKELPGNQTGLLRLQRLLRIK